jgi:dethiobiotin synthetase
MTIRVYIVGTDTGVGKTAVACALLRHARARGLAALPFKPVVTGPLGPDSDPARLLRAVDLPQSELDTICPLRYPEPIAPGLAAHRPHFLGDPAPATTSTFLDRASTALRALEHRLTPKLVFIEAAGGLLVPMPGGLWQPDWIRALAARVLVVGRAELGTINHTCLTIDALRGLGLDPVGFILSETSDVPDPSRRDNAPILAQARHLPHLGTLPHHPDLDAPFDTTWLRNDIWHILCPEIKPPTSCGDV